MSGNASAAGPSVALAGIVLGAGLGGMLDGIVLHQVLQWHHMLTGTGRHPATTVAGLEANTLADGLFHLGAWLLVVGGLVLTWRVRRHDKGSGRALGGWVLAGWGCFNVVEGLVDHHVLGIHHVRAGPNGALYDVAYLALGVALLVGGWLIARSGAGRAAART